MPAALAKFKLRYFDSATDLQTFVSTDLTIVSVVSIVFDNSGKYVLFYMVS